jgi:TP901 family phage tail tape measure protein
MPEQIGVEVVAVGVAAFSRALRTAQDDLERFQGSILTSANSATTLGNNLISIGGNMERLGRAMTIGITAPLGILAGTLISAGIAFEDSFAGITKTVDGLGVGFDEIRNAAQSQLGIVVTNMDEARDAAAKMGISFGDLTPLGEEVRKQFREMALEIPLTASELNKFGETAGQFGVAASEIEGVTRSMAALEVATNLAGDAAGSQIIQLRNITKSSMDMSEFVNRAGSALVYLGNSSVSTESQILDATMRIAAAGDAANFTEQEMFAWGTTISDLGVRAEKGGTAVSRMINEMLIAVETGSDNLGTFAGVMGISVEDLQKMFEEDASNAIFTFTQALTTNIKAGNVSKKMLTELGLGGVRAIDVVQRLSGAQDMFTTNLDNANKSWAEGVALQEEAEKRYNTVKSQIQLTKNAFNDLGITIFDLVKGDISNLLEKIREGITWFKNLDAGLIKTILKFAGIAAAIGPVLVVLGALISAVGTVFTAIGGIPTALKLISRTLLSTLGPVGLLISGLMLLIPLLSGTGFKLNIDFSEIIDKFNGLVETVKTSLGEIVSAFANLKIGDTGLLESLQGLLDTLINSIINKITSVMEFFQDMAKGFSDTFTPFIVDKGPQIERILINVKTIVDEVRTAFEKAGAAIAAALGLNTNGTGVGEFLGALAGLAFEELLNGLEAVTGFIAKLDEGITKIAENQAVKDVISGIADSFIRIRDAAAGISVSWINGVASGFQNITNSIANSETLQSFVSLIKTLFDIISKFAWQAINDNVNNLKDAVRGFIEGITPFIQSQGPRLQQIWENLATVWERLGPLFEAIEKLAQAFEKLGAAAGINVDWETIGKFFGFLAGLVLDGIIRGIEWFTKSLIDAVSIMTILVNAGTRFVLFLQNSSGTISGVAANIGSAISRAFSPIVNLFDAARNSIDRMKETFYGVQNTINNVMWSFDMLQWKIGNVVNTAKWYLDQLGSKVQEVLRMITGSPELIIQHPFEKFEGYLKAVDFSKLIEGSMALNSMNQISMVAPSASSNQQTITNDRRVQANITGVPMDTASGIVDILQRQTRMAEVFQS